ncbi:MAG: hypothetical protein MSIBF_02860 [Candidatus Altiarchaeales archaeon IMC4]|nr:MAG: hypothetical protein MSIBF_02860 [Candidatus Altiarchaeales archaeon IMC4]
MIKRVLKDSFAMLAKSPKLFIPRILDTCIYSVFMVYLTFISIEFFSVIAYDYEFAGACPDLSVVAPFFSDFALLFFLFIVVYFTDILTYAMYPRLVSDYRKNQDVCLIAAYKDAISNWRKLLVFGLVVLSLLVVFLFAIGIFYALALEVNIVFMIFGVLISVLALFVFGVLFFFVIPIALIENRGILKSFSESVKLGFRHRGPLIKINAVFIALILLVLAALSLIGFSEGALYAGIAVFVVGRLTQAVVYTYFCVANPNMYLFLSEK